MDDNKKIDQDQKEYVDGIIEELKAHNIPISELLVIGYHYDAKYFDDNVRCQCGECGGECWIRPYHPSDASLICTICADKIFDFKRFSQVQLNLKKEKDMN